jgi:Uma2 family endonuclease
MSATAKKRMTAWEFLAWAEAQPDGKRCRLIDGEPVAMAPERSRQSKAKFRAAKALEAAVERAGLPCHVFPDGITVLADEYTPYEPDAVLYCGAEIDDEATVLSNPLIVVDVLSPSTAHVDTGAKLAGYFRIDSVQHYLIIDTVGRRMVRHSRRSGRQIDTTIIESGEIRLDPPGISIAFEAILPPRRTA